MKTDTLNSSEEAMSKTERIELAKILIPESIPRFEEIEARYPERDLPSDARVVRVAPSPTGFAHFGLIYTAMVNQQEATQTGGVFFLRIEDTDKEREVPQGAEKIIKALEDFDITFQEGPTLSGGEMGSYGPYIQSKRREIYLSAARELLERGEAYPCFCTKEELEKVRQTQESAHARTGYYGEYAACRNLSLKEVRARVAAGDSYTIRFKAPQEGRKVEYHDAVKGNISFPSNDVDYILVKSGDGGLGLPVYHLAAMVDDHLQRVNLVLRGDEWMSSLPLHLQIAAAFGWDSPEYGHLSPVMKMEGAAKRKLSKRKDPEAAATYYLEQGIPSRAVRAYVFTLADSRFEDWRKAHPNAPLNEFPFVVSHMGASAGALFDMVKFKDICKNEIANMSAGEVYDNVKNWSAKYNSAFHALLTKDAQYSTRIFGIEREGNKRRKDISAWSDVPAIFGYFYDEIYESLPLDLRTENVADMESAQAIIQAFLETYDSSDDKDMWMKKMQEVCVQLGYATSAKDYKEAPDRYKGNLGDVAMILRIGLSGRAMTPDLYEMMQVMGKDRVVQRLKKVLD